MQWHALSRPALALAVSLGSSILAESTLAAGTCTPEWSDQFPGGAVDAPVRCIEVISVPGEESSVYIGGSLHVAGGLTVNGIARWTGERWETLCDGIDLTDPATSVYAIAGYDDGAGVNIFAAGSFLKAPPGMQGIRQWDGAVWTTVGGGMNDSVRDLLVFNDGVGREPALFACGAFTQAGDVRASHIARWDGDSWSGIEGGLNDQARAMVVFDDGDQQALYVAGAFTEAGGNPAVGVARWNGRAWSAVGSLRFASLRDIIVHDEGDGPKLYACGDIDLGDGTEPGYRVIRWNDGIWEAMGGIFNASTVALASHVDARSGSSQLHVGGLFTQLDGAEVRRLARWDADHWTPIDVGNGGVFALTSAPDRAGGPSRLWVGGAFTVDLDESASGKHLTLWDGQQFLPLGNGVSKSIGGGDYPAGSVRALLEVDSTPGIPAGIYAGGNFVFAGQQLANSVARWDGQAWSALGQTFQGVTNAIRMFDDGGGPMLFAAGEYHNPSTVFNEFLRRWDGSRWVMVPIPYFSGQANAMCVYDDGSGRGAMLCVGGVFKTVFSHDNVLQWDGRTWTALPSLNGYVYTLQPFDDGTGDGPALFVGGRSLNDLDEEFGVIAKWDGVEWSALGEGLTGPAGFIQQVVAMTIYDDGSGSGTELLVGGVFSQAGGVAAKNIAKWNGSRWAALAPQQGSSGACPGVCGAVLSLHVHDDGRGEALFVGGRFLDAGGVPVRHIARWDGREWSSLGQGVSNSFDAGTDDEYVMALASFQNGRDRHAELFVGGQFTLAGTQSAQHVASWKGCGPGPSVADLDGDGFVGPLDLALLLAAWGDCPPVGACAADLNGSGKVDGFDLAILLAAWG